MEANILCDIIKEHTDRSLWETENLIACVPDDIWNKRYDGIPMWKFIYHMLFSMDRWFMNPNDPTYKVPEFHHEFLNDLNVIPEAEEVLSRKQLEQYFHKIKRKIQDYVLSLTDEQLKEYPDGCKYVRFKLILGQIKHWHRHMGVIYGFVIEDAGKWPFVLNMEAEIPKEGIPVFYP